MTYMEKPAAQALDATTLHKNDRVLAWVENVVLVVGGSLLVALCARITLPLPFTPVPLTLQNFGVLLVGLLLGSKRGFAALALYLAEGAMGMPVFSLAGLGGIAQLLGPTGGYLMMYPFVAFLAGYVMERGAKSFARAAIASILAEIVLFAGGIGWLVVWTHSISLALRFGLYWFVFAEIIKVMSAAAIARGWQRFDNTSLS
jgi:biotin transport system substrate-specific component